MAVATTTGKSQERIYGELQQAAKSYFVTSTAGMKDITEAMYQLGTAGLSTEQIMSGFEHVMNLSIGTYSDVTTAGRLMAGIFNVFGDELKEAGDTAEQMQYVSDLLATAWQNNQIELGELNTAMGHLAASGKVVGLGLKELIAISSVMSDALLRGGKGGRLMARGFIQLAKEGKKLDDLGVIFDPTKPLDFHAVMSQLHTIYQKQGKSLVFLNELVDIFGARGIKSVGGVLEQFEKFNKEVGRTPEVIDGASASLAQIAQLSRGDLIKKIWHKAITGVNKPEKTQLRKEVEELVASNDDRIKQMIKLNALVSQYGDKLGLSAEALKVIAKQNKELEKIPLIDLAKDSIQVAWKHITSDTKEVSVLYNMITARAKTLRKVQNEQRKAAGLPEIKLIDKVLERRKDALNFQLAAIKGESKTSIVLTKINKLLALRNTKAVFLKGIKKNWKVQYILKNY